MSDKNRAKKFGEVLTPAVLVSEMLDTLPAEIWKDPNLTWCDNSCGKGAFLLEIKRRLLDFHSEQHIIDKMLFGFDIQADNVEATKAALGLDADAPNIVCADYLALAGRSFDVVAMNPPYNRDKSAKKKGNTTSPLWESFVEKAISELRPGGFLVAVHPPLWRKPEHRLLNLFQANQVLSLRMIGFKESKKLFGCGTKVDFYCLQKAAPTRKTVVVDELGVRSDIFLGGIPFLPNGKIVETLGLFSTDRETTFDVLYNCKYHHHSCKFLSVEKDEQHTLPCVYLANNKGVVYRWASQDLGHFGVSKAIIPMGSYRPIWDGNGSLGMCEVAFGVLTEDKGVFDALCSEPFKAMIKHCTWKTFQLDWKMFRYLRKDFANLLLGEGARADLITKNH
jgi:hypothetical protein